MSYTPSDMLRDRWPVELEEAINLIELAAASAFRRGHDAGLEAGRVVGYDAGFQAGMAAASPTTPR